MIGLAPAPLQPDAMQQRNGSGYRGSM